MRPAVDGGADFLARDRRLVPAAGMGRQEIAGVVRFEIAASIPTVPCEMDSERRSVTLTPGASCLSFVE
jgi:hypothetical protein